MKYRYCWVDATDEHQLDEMGQAGWHVVPGTMVVGSIRMVGRVAIDEAPSRHVRVLMELEWSE